jgi:hypothetical protein
VSGVVDFYVLFIYFSLFKKKSFGFKVKFKIL